MVFSETFLKLKSPYQNQNHKHTFLCYRIPCICSDKQIKTIFELQDYCKIKLKKDGKLLFHFRKL
jgi:hypothetical protein